MNSLSTPTEKILDLFFSAIGFRDLLIADDSAVLPYIEKALQDTPYAGLEIGKRAPGRYYEHAVRFLGEDHVVKFVEPAPLDVMKRWLKKLRKQKTILERYLPHNLPAFSYFYVPLGNNAAAGKTRPDRSGRLGNAAAFTSGRATYALVMEKIEGRPLYALSNQEIFSNSELVGNLINFLEGNQEMRKEEGLFADLVGGPAHRILNPRYTGNLYVTDSNEVKLVDTVLIPPSSDPKTTPPKYRLAKLYHFCYRTLVLPREKGLVRKLRAG